LPIGIRTLYSDRPALQPRLAAACGEDRVQAEGGNFTAALDIAYKNPTPRAAEIAAMMQQ
jgi:hypothetical protein